MKRLAAVFGLILATPAMAAAIDVADAGKHVGDNVTVEGVVNGVHAAPNGMIVIELGGHYPDNIFEAVIFPRNAGAFGGVNGYVGNRVQISGPVELYHGKPEITLTNLGQIQVINASRGQKLTA